MAKSSFAKDVLIAFSTVPDPKTARTIARTLVEEGLAACVHILPGGESFYLWEGKFNQDPEWTLIFKLPAGNYSKLEKRLKALHPYDVPELLAVPVTHGLPAYLAWAGVTGKEPSD